MIDQIKKYQGSRLDIDEVVVLLAHAKLYRTQYQELGESVPDWLNDGIVDIQRDIHRRTRDRKVARLNDLQHSIEKYKTPAEKRDAAEKEAAVLAKELGLKD